MAMLMNLGYLLSYRFNTPLFLHSLDKSRSTMVIKKGKKCLSKETKLKPKPVSLMKQEIHTEGSKLNISVESIPIEECAVEIAVDQAPMDDLTSNIAVSETLNEVIMPGTPVERLTIVRPLHDSGVADVIDEVSKACDYIPKQPRSS